MSYDLSFATRDGSPLDPEAFAEHFEGRSPYRVNDEQAWYANEDTGTYFGFALENPNEFLDPEERVVDDEPFPVTASFELNYFRPRTFALEAAPELEAFVERFDLVVDDSQIDGMGRGEFSTDGFLAGWEVGNRFACQSILSQNPEIDFPTLPAETLRRAWNWNRCRSELQEREREETFVPRIMYLRPPSRGEEPRTLQTVVVWGDGIPALLPKVDAVLVGRHELAPKRLFFFRRPDAALVPWSDVATVLAHFPAADDPVEHIQARYSERPAEVERFVREVLPLAQSPELYPVEQVLETEVIEEARRAGPPEGMTFGPEEEES